MVRCERIWKKREEELRWSKIQFKKKREREENGELRKNISTGGVVLCKFSQRKSKTTNMSCDEIDKDLEYGNIQEYLVRSYHWPFIHGMMRSSRELSAGRRYALVRLKRKECSLYVCSLWSNGRDGPLICCLDLGILKVQGSAINNLLKQQP